VILLLLTFAGIAAFDLLPLFAHRQKSAIAAFLLLFVLALVISVLLVQNVKVPSAVLLLGELLESLGLSY